MLIYNLKSLCTEMEEKLYYIDIVDRMVREVNPGQAYIVVLPCGGKRLTCLPLKILHEK